MYDSGKVWGSGGPGASVSQNELVPHKVLNNDVIGNVFLKNISNCFKVILRC